jgi:hypothetical protein
MQSVRWAGGPIKVFWDAANHQAKEPSEPDDEQVRPQRRPGEEDGQRVAACAVRRRAANIMSVMFFGRQPDDHVVALDIEHAAYLNVGNVNARALLEFRGLGPSDDLTGEITIPEARRAIMRASAILGLRVGGYTRDGSRNSPVSARSVSGTRWRARRPLLRAQARRLREAPGGGGRAGSDEHLLGVSTSGQGRDG